MTPRQVNRGSQVRAVGLLVATGLALSGCASAGHSAAAAFSPAAPTSSPTAKAAPGTDPAAVGANELGLVPVLMIHEIVALPRRVYDRTPEQFHALLQRLWDENYRPITAHDYVTGPIDIPAGTPPVVITLDDAYTNQAQIDSAGHPKADTALGILEAFGAAHPAFHPTATFYVNTYPPPFVDAKVLPWLAA